MPQSDRAPSFQFYPRDFWSDPCVLELTLAEVGSYVRILSMSWMSDEPGVISESDLPRLSGFGGQWPRHSEAIGRCFDRSVAGVWKQKRMVAERKLQHDRYMAASTAGRKSQQIQRRPLSTLEAPSSHLATPASASASASASALESTPASSLRSEAPEAPETFAARLTAEAKAPTPAERGMRAGIGLVAEKLSLAPKRASPFPKNTAWEWVTQQLRPQDPKTAMGFLAWLWDSGTHNLEDCKSMLRETLDKDIRNPHAYWAPNGTARTCRSDQIAMARAEAEATTQKAEERRWNES